MKTALLHLWFVFCAAIPLTAKDDTDTTHKPSDAKGRVAYFVYTDMPEGLENPVSIMTGKDLIELALSKRSASEAVKIPADGILRIVRKAENPSGLVFHAKVQDLAAFKGGDYLYLNLTKMNVGVELGKTKIEIKPGETKIYNAPALTEATNVSVRYSFYHPTEQLWKMLSASTIVLQSTRREICIFSWDPSYNRIDYHGITFPVTQ
jgi:hypothetical protein